MKQFGLIGETLVHSFSADFFTKKFKAENIDANYKLYELKNLETEFPLLLKNTSNLCGLNVTIPYKQRIFPFLDKIDADAEEIGAVNVIKFSNGKLIGYNTDVVGFEMSLTKHLLPHHTKALILGTGGASKAVAFVLQKLGIEFTFVSRTKANDNYTYNELNEETIKEHLLIINASPVGTYPRTEDAPNIPYLHLSTKHYLFDLIYNPNQTLFLKRGAERGCITQNGLEMLHGQAIAAWKIWQD